MDEFKPTRDQRDLIHREIGKQKRGARNLEYDELRQIFIDIVGKPK
jgi:hypothetical protein